MKRLALLLACSLWVSSALAQDKAEDQIARVKANFAGKSLADINSALASMRPEAFGESDKKKLLLQSPYETRFPGSRALQALGTTLTGIELIFFLLPVAHRCGMFHLKQDRMLRVSVSQHL